MHREAFSARYVMRIVAPLVLLGLVLVSIVAFALPPLIVSGLDDRAAELELENQVRTTMLQALAGILFLLTAFFTWRNIQVTRDGQLTERYAKAIEMLGDENLMIRTGAVLSLQRVAHDSIGDRATINEILAAFVRETSSDRRKHAGEEPRAWSGSPVPIDVQAALAALGSEDLLVEHKRPTSAALDLKRIVADGAQLRNAIFEGADLSGARFRDADLRGANLCQADLDGADLGGAQLTSAHFDEASMFDAHLENADLTSASFVGTFLGSAHLEDAVLYGADLRWSLDRGAPFCVPPQLSGARYSSTTRWPDSHTPSGEDCKDACGDELAHKHHHRVAAAPPPWKGRT